MEGKEKLLGGICQRCEHRARYLETGHAPRAECGWPETSKHSCYMYCPVMPIVMERDEFEKEIAKEYGFERPSFGPWMFSARMHMVRLPKEEMELVGKEVEGGTLAYWRPKEDR
jgi:hypothetical protein